MSARFSAASIAKRHFASFGGSAGQVLLDVAEFGVIPTLFGLVCGLGGFSMQSASSAFVTGVSILSALLCAMAVMVFQLRVQVNYNDDPLVPPSQRDLLDETFYNILWAIVVGLAIVVLLVLGEAFCWFSGKCVVCGLVLSSLVIATGVHFVLTVFMVLKRLARAYEIVGMHLG